MFMLMKYKSTTLLSPETYTSTFSFNWITHIFQSPYKIPYSSGLYSEKTRSFCNLTNNSGNRISVKTFILLQMKTHFLYSSDQSSWAFQWLVSAEVSQLLKNYFVWLTKTTFFDLRIKRVPITPPKRLSYL